MQTDLQISFHNVDHSDAVDASIRTEADKLDKVYDRITACRVAVEAPHRHQHKGKLYRVRVDLVVPGAELIAARNPSAHGAHTDIHIAVRDAFRAARRQLQDHTRRRRGPTGAAQ